MYYVKSVACELVLNPFSALIW